MWSDKNCGLYLANKVLYTNCQSWPLPLTSWPKIDRVPSLVLLNLHVKFVSDWTKTAVCFLLIRLYKQITCTKWIVFLLSSRLTLKFESDLTRTVVCIVPTRFNSQSAKVEIDLWFPQPKINRVPTLINYNSNVNLKVIGQKMWSVSCPQCLFYRQRAKVDVDLWPHYPKSIDFLLLLWTTYM